MCCLHVNIPAIGCPSLVPLHSLSLKGQPARPAAEAGACIWQEICKCWLRQLGLLGE